MTTATLTRDAILAMEAGPEMDALVAERVMGWVRHPRKFDGYEAWGVPGEERFHTRLVDEFEASTRMDSAWEVVEKLKPLSPVLCVWPDFTEANEGETPYRLHLSMPKSRCGSCRHEHGSDIEVWEATAPLAICRAALLAAIEAHAALLAKLEAIKPQGTQA